MIRVPYDQIAIEATKFIENMALANDIEIIDRWWKMYVDLLEASGWDIISYNQEMLKRINEDWDEIKPIIRN